jgi:hypothetical protein
MRTAEDRSVRLASVNRRAHWDDSVVDEDGHWTGECAGNARHGEPPQHDSLGVATRIQVPETTVDLLIDLLEREASRAKSGAPTPTVVFECQDAGTRRRLPIRFRSRAI